MRACQAGHCWPVSEKHLPGVSFSSLLMREARWALALGSGQASGDPSGSLGNRAEEAPRVLGATSFLGTGQPEEQGKAGVQAQGRNLNFCFIENCASWR